MSKCDITVIPQKNNYKVGDTIKGEVKVVVDAECKCDALTIEKYWQTHGKGNRSSGCLEVDTLFSGVWQPGVYVYSFSFELKEGPLSYHGHIINIDWYLNARADIPWRFDPAAEIDFILEKSEEVISGTDSNDDFNYIDRKKIPLNDQGWWKLFPLIFFVIGLVLMYTGESLFVGSVFTLVGAFIFYKMIQSAFAERKLGKVLCTVEKEDCRPGENFNASIMFTPRENLDINSVTVKLLGKEIAVSGSGTNKSTHTHAFFEEKLALLEKKALPKDFPVDRKCQLKVPDVAPASFYQTDNKIEWSVVFEVDIPRWPDWYNKLPIKIIN